MEPASRRSLRFPDGQHGTWSKPYDAIRHAAEQETAHAAAPVGAHRDKVRALYGGDPQSDGYLKFIVRELRPMIDKRFNVKTDRANTVIMGSSIIAHFAIVIFALV